ncbi:MAG: 16S rRNA (guanine(966)-N(2))-methyltransferase RsmD [Actinobacteria bacterium]|nr:16S rRNA (guanine(966)-N(2))-methyltransferase RsmD [Actinomycetota bacterium]
MRVIAGAAKGRKLRAPGEGTRPMMDRVREALFSSLGPVVEGADVLDLFAGSGSIGIEALSRGAARVVFVERARGAVRVLRANLGDVGLGGEVVPADAAAYLASTPDTFDLVFVDPPYALPLPSVEEILGLVAARLRPGGVVVVHRRAGTGTPRAAGLAPAAVRTYGDTEITRFETEEDR